MAEKGFGVKEVNLIGASGTPTITSPNNINLNAANVAISTNVSIGGTLSVTGNVSVGGTLTYEDVTNIDSVGIITARSGVTVSSGNVTTPSINLTNNGLNLTSSHNIAVSATGLYVNNTSNNATIASFQFSTGCILRDTNGAIRLYTQTSGATVTGTLTATTFSGSGASLTNIPAANITGTLPAISGANLTGITITPTATDVQVAYELLSTSASGAGWRITGNGIVNTVNNPDLYLIRGQKYRFINNSGGSHPFRIQSDSSTAYNTGVTNNNASSGNIDFVPQNDAPARLYYNCTNHGGMLGNIYLRGAGGNETNVGVVTATSFESTTFSKTPTNTPAFHAFRNGNISPSISDATNTKITILTTETLDTDNAYDNSSGGTTANRFTVPSGKGGYYNVSAGINFYGDGNDIRHARIFIQKNGVTTLTAYGFVSSYAAGTRHFQCNLNGILNLSAGDYLELYAYIDVNSNANAYISNDVNGLRGNHFSAFKLII